MMTKPMRRITEPFATAADQLAVDEALLLEADQNGGETLRIWEFSRSTVVLGRSSKVDLEVDREYCEAEAIPILRRCSGGATVVGGPGCLMYSVVIGFDQHPELQKIDAAHQYVMRRVLAAVRRQVPEAQFQGTCDLTWNDQKFSGNSLRIARHHLLYHGTILYAADLDHVARCLKDAPRQPDYRAGRQHRSFITNVPVDSDQLGDAIADEFGAQADHRYPLPQQRIEELRQQRYTNQAWHLRH